VRRRGESKREASERGLATDTKMLSSWRMMAEEDDKMPEVAAFSNAHPRISFSSLGSAICRSGELAPSRLWVPREKASCRSVLLSASLATHNLKLEPSKKESTCCLRRRICPSRHACICARNLSSNGMVWACE
jgi:hypothetical protein